MWCCRSAPLDCSDVTWTYDVSNYRQLDCLFNRFRKIHQIPHHRPFAKAIHYWPVNSPAKGPVVRKVKWFHVMGSSVVHYLFKRMISMINSRHIAVEYNTILQPAQPLRLKASVTLPKSRKTPIFRPYGRAMGVIPDLFGEKWPRNIGSAPGCIKAPHVVSRHSRPVNNSKNSLKELTQNIPLYCLCNDI